MLNTIGYRYEIQFHSFETFTIVGSSRSSTATITIVFYYSSLTLRHIITAFTAFTSFDLQRETFHWNNAREPRAETAVYVLLQLCTPVFSHLKFKVILSISESQQCTTLVPFSRLLASVGLPVQTEMTTKPTRSHREMKHFQLSTGTCHVPRCTC